SQFNELHTYLHAYFSILDSDDDDFDILQWWKKRQPKFPVLSQLARDILTIPVLTVYSKSAFSTTGRILEERRTSLTSDMVDVLACLRDWEHIRKRMQFLKDSHWL
ncbi:HAT, C-terminal dimerization domain containing protein, partial [Parasponia andersonii]